MSAYDERSLRRLFRQMVWVVATASGCGASVTVSVGDAAVDASPPVDVAAPGDVPTLADVPVVRDVPVVTDRGACDPIRTVSNPSTLCPSGTVVFPCGLPPELLLDAGESIVDQTLCATLCQLPTAMFGSPYCSLATTPEGARSLNCQIPCPGGRRPEGFCDVALDGPETTGAWFARLAALESASVTAFDRMVFELTLHGAPADLIAQISPCIRPPHYENDFAAEIARQLEAAGIRDIHDCGTCTATDPDSYYSYRREKGFTGRMLAFLALSGGE